LARFAYWVEVYWAAAVGAEHDSGCRAALVHRVGEQVGA